MGLSIIVACVCVCCVVLSISAPMVTDARRSDRHTTWGWWRNVQPLFVGKRSNMAAQVSEEQVELKFPSLLKKFSNSEVRELSDN